MSGHFHSRSDSRVIIYCAAAVVSLALAPGVDLDARQPPLPTVTRAQMIETARRMAEHSWVAKANNLEAPCVKNYKSRFKKDQKVLGVAYDWGGMDDGAAFAKKLLIPLAAGSHKDEGVTPCTTGVDCSGFVSLCWQQTKKFGTSTIGEIADPLKEENKFTDLKPGDALNKAGSHIVLFVAYRPNGKIDVYESAGSASRVVLSEAQDWARFKKYLPIRYKATVE
jgi:hypothetical protein